MAGGQPGGGTLTPLDEYRFDVGGWFVLPGLLSPAHLARLSARAELTHEDAEALSVDPILRATLKDLMTLGDYNPDTQGGEGGEGVPQLLTPPAPLDGAISDGFLRQWADGRVRVRDDSPAP